MGWGKSAKTHDPVNSWRGQYGVETGGEVIIKRDTRPIAVICAGEPVRRKISKCMALMPSNSTATIDPDFAKDVQAAIDARRDPAGAARLERCSLDSRRRC